MERSLYQQQRRLPHRGGVSYERMMFLERVFESRSAPTDYDEALADKILRIDAILEMFQGRRCSLIQQHQLLDCSLTEKAAARVQEAIRRSDKDYTAISSNDPSHADQLCPFVAPQTDSLAEAHIRDEQPEKPPRFESLNFGTSKLSRKRPASPSKLFESHFSRHYLSLYWLTSLRVVWNTVQTCRKHCLWSED